MSQYKLNVKGGSQLTGTKNFEILISPDTLTSPEKDLLLATHKYDWSGNSDEILLELNKKELKMLICMLQICYDQLTSGLE